MKTTITRLVLLTLLLASIQFTAHSQNVKRKNVTTHYLHYPLLDLTDINTYTIKVYPGSNPMSQNDLYLRKGLGSKLQELQDNINNISGPEYVDFKPISNVEENADLLIEIAFGNFEVISKTLKEHKIPCKLEGVKLTKETLMECPAYYYDIKYNLPTVLTIRDIEGTVLFAKEQKAKGTTRFGYSDAAGHIVKAKLEAAYAHENALSSIAHDEMRKRIENFADPVQNCISFNYEEEKLKIATGSGKEYDYTLLMETQTSVAAALSAFRKKGTDPAERLKAAIGIWEEELQGINTEDKKARINRKIAVDLYGNITIANMYLNKFDKAQESMNELMMLFNGMVNVSQSDEWARLRSKLYDRKPTAHSVTVNAALVDGACTKIPKILESMLTNAKNSEYSNISRGKEYATVRADFVAWNEAGKKTHVTDDLEDLLTASLADIINETADEASLDYRSRIESDPASNQYALRMYPFAGDSYSELPIEICALTELTQLNATGMDKFTTIPDEIGNLTNLTVLNLYSNSNLKAIPSTIVNMTNLQELNVSNCSNLTSFPEEIKQMKSLRKIRLWGTGIPASEVAALKKALPDCKIK